MPFDLSDALDDDWDTVFDEVGQATLERDGSNIATGIDALVFEEQIVRIGGLTDGEKKVRTIILRASQMSGLEPAQDDVIVVQPSGAVASMRYVVDTYTRTDLEPDFQCICVKEV